LIRYSFGIWRGLADYWLNIQSVYAGVRWITDQIFIPCMHGSGGLPIGYSIIGMIRLGGLELDIE
jgi:hypothetical protein